LPTIRGNSLFGDNACLGDTSSGNFGNTKPTRNQLDDPLQGPYAKIKIQAILVSHRSMSNVSAS